jgi:hypothetical protein
MINKEKREKERETLLSIKRRSEEAMSNNKKKRDFYFLTR